LSWTQTEYRYAREKRIPVLAFVRENTHISANQTEVKDADAQGKLERFKAELLEHHLSRGRARFE